MHTLARLLADADGDGFTMLCFLRSWHLGSIGAVLIVSAILIEPFLQQMPNCLSRMRRTESAMMAHSTYYTDWEWTENTFIDCQWSI